MLDEFDRLLKSGGQLAFNETIWLPNQDPLKIKAFNESCLNHFGIIQLSLWPWFWDYMH